jgi:hypothetical protein
MTVESKPGGDGEETWEKFGAGNEPCHAFDGNSIKNVSSTQGTIRLGRLIYVFEPTFDYSAHLLYACALYLRLL